MEVKKERNQSRPRVGAGRQTAGGLPGTVRPEGVPGPSPLDVWDSKPGTLRTSGRQNGNRGKWSRWPSLLSDGRSGAVRSNRIVAGRGLS